MVSGAAVRVMSVRAACASADFSPVGTCSARAIPVDTFAPQQASRELEAQAVNVVDGYEQSSELLPAVLGDIERNDMAVIRHLDHTQERIHDRSPGFTLHFALPIRPKITCSHHHRGVLDETESSRVPHPAW